MPYFKNVSNFSVDYFTLAFVNFTIAYYAISYGNCEKTLSKTKIFKIMQLALET